LREHPLPHVQEEQFDRVVTNVTTADAAPTPQFRSGITAGPLNITRTSDDFHFLRAKPVSPRLPASSI
jgi:hypothetical protein